MILSPSQRNQGPGPVGGATAAPASSALDPMAPKDTVELGSAPPPKHQKLHKIVRFGLDASNFFTGDLPTLAATGANMGIIPLTEGLKHSLGLINGPNLVSDVIGTAIDAKQLHDVLKNPNSTKLDRHVEESHFVVSDILPTLGAALPLVVGLSNPIVAAAFVATQVVGVVADVAKIGYDIHRKGNQS